MRGASGNSVSFRESYFSDKHVLYISLRMKDFSSALNNDTYLFQTSVRPFPGNEALLSNLKGFLCATFSKIQQPTRFLLFLRPEN